MMTKKAFREAYCWELLRSCMWTSGNEGIKKLEKFMESVRLTIAEAPDTRGKATWSHKGPCVTAAWHTIGGKGVPTLKALRSLPNE